jgi:hypothetical protein
MANNMGQSNFTRLTAPWAMTGAMLSGTVTPLSMLEALHGHKPSSLRSALLSPMTETALSGPDERAINDAAASARAIIGGCYLTAIVDGNSRLFPNPQAKFEALAESWKDYNLGKSVVEYHDFAMQQIIGMGATAVPFLIERLSAGEPEWIYALKSIAGQEADTPEMLGDEDRVVRAWLEWGSRDGAKR